MILDPSWLKSSGIWPVLLSSPLTQTQQLALSEFNFKDFDFTFDTDKQLALWKDQFQQSSEDEKCRYLWAGRGGYGTTRLLSMLTLEEIKSYFKNKIFIGYSDLTAIHQIYARFGWPSFHGAVLAELVSQDKDKSNFDDLMNLCEKGYSGYKAGVWRKITTEKPLKPKKHAGKLTGGNLSILQCGIGTPWLHLEKYDYLFIEDINVKPYQIDRMLWHLYQADIFKGKKGIFVGHLGQEHHHIEEILIAWSYRLKVDIFVDIHFGHGQRNKPLIFHTPFSLESLPDGNFAIAFH